MRLSDIKGFRYNGNEVAAIALGGDLIYNKEPDAPVYADNVLAGKMTEPGKHVFSKINAYYYFNTEPDGTFIYDNFKSVTTCSEMFSSNRKIQEIYHFPNLSNIKAMRSMFSECTALISVNLSNLNTSAVTDMGYMFSGCTALTTVILGDYDTSKVTDFGVMFRDCSALINVSGNITGIKVAIDLSPCPLLTNSSAMVFINGLAEVSSTKKITFKSTTFNTLSSEQIALATSRGWTVVSA